jgi:hypothetical protein
MTPVKVRKSSLMKYHIRRNAIAKASHDRTWLAKHKGVKFLLL